MFAIACNFSLGLVAVLAGIGFSSWGDQAVYLNESTRQAIVGGSATPVTPGCKRIVTTCTDPSGLKSTCTINQVAQQCEMCSKTVTNYQECDYSQTMQPNCTSTTSTTYCGAVWYGTMSATMGCQNQCTTSAGVDCGLQIPTVTGVPCP